jgi:UDP-N-acetylmuramate--alanine ligase
MSGIAEVLANLGYQVTGSDLAASETTERLAGLGCHVTSGHSADNVKGADVVVISSAVRQDNPEVVAARTSGIPVIPRASMLNELMRMKYGIAIAGSHGKTTVTSMVAMILAEANMDPTVVIGGKLDIFGTNAKLGEGDYLVAEADESDGSFLQLTPTIAVVTNMDNEHMDHYGDFDTLRRAFGSFLEKVPFYGRAILCLDDPEVAGLMGGLDRPSITYGLSTQADVSADAVEYRGFGSIYQARLGSEKLGTVELNVPGEYNVYNSLAAIAVGMELDVPFAAAAAALEKFTGAQRRFQMKGEAAGVTVYDDYGHHPAEIKATLGAARQGWDGRVIALFQPHRYSRTKDLLAEFGTAFHNADCVYITDIYAASEDPVEGLTGQSVVDAVRDRGHRCVNFAGSRPEAVRRVVQDLEPGDLLITLGAGDIWRWGEEVLGLLKEKS